MRLVTHRATSGCFSCRSISKQNIELHNRHNRLVQEREYLLTLHSQFIVNLVSTFKDITTIYILEEFCPGGTVYNLLKRQRDHQLEENAIGNILGCVIHGLRVCHDHSILVRALAPENLFIDKKGLVKLSNFEFSKKILPGAFTMTVCGSNEYMSPEQMYGHGQTLASDYWGLGCLMYELFIGRTPFSDSSHNMSKVR